MPYKVFADGDGFKVWKVDEQGEKVGEAMSKKPLSKDKADAQARDLYASENKKKDAYISVAASDTLTFGTTDNLNGSTETKDMGGMEMEGMPPSYGPCSWEELDAAEAAFETAEHMNDMTWKFRNMANAIINNPMIEDKAQALVDAANGYAERIKGPVEEKDMGAVLSQLAGDNQKAQMGAAQVNNLPDSDFLYIESGGKKDDGGKTVPRSLRHLPVPDEAHIRNAITRLSQSGTGTSGGEKWLTPALRKSLLAKARKMLESKKELPPKLAIWKEGSIYRWIAAYSNNQRDSDSPAEIITSDSHKEFDLALHNKEWPMPELWLWHIPYPVGITQYHAYDESTGYPVAAGVFKEGCEWAAEGLQSAGWTAISHGMPDRWIERSKEDSTLIVRHRTKEISFLPQWAAANKNTVSFILKESTMTDEVQKGLPAHKRPEFIAAFGEERVKQIEEALASKAKEAQEQGVETKEKEPTMADVVKALEFLTTELVALKNQVNEKPVVKEAPEEFDLVARLKSLSAVGQPTTKVDGRSKEAKDGPEEAKTPTPTQELVGLSVPLVDKIFQANQAYYNGGAK